MSNLQSNYAVSTRLIAWGDGLDHQQLVSLMDVDALTVNMEKKGELIQSSASSRTRNAKTGMMSVLFDNDQNSFNPVAQLDDVSERLSKLSKEELRNCGVERSELQLSAYYEKVNPMDAEYDFAIPGRLIDLLAKAGIQLRVTVMP